MKKVIKFLLIAGMLSTLLPACKKSLIELETQGAYSYSTYFNNSKALNEATIATYATLLHNGLWAREYYFIFDLLGYEAKKTVNMQGDMAQLATYQFGSNQAQIGQLWLSLYRMIFRANVVLDRANVWQPATATDQQNVKQYVAEAKFLRAYSYFNIVSLWGDAPLITSYDSTIINNYAPRVAAANIWAAVEKDLTEAVTDLPVSYPAADLGRATQGAAIALLGKVYLYEKKYPEAQSQLTKLTMPPFTYSIANVNYDDLFSPTNQNNTETIFQVMNASWNSAIGNQYYVFSGQENSKATHSDRAQEYGFNDWNNVYITQAAVKAFTYPNPNGDGTMYTDPRANSTFYGDKPSGGDTVYCEQCATGPISFPFDATDLQGTYKWKKYEYYEIKKNYGGPESSINAQVIRYADVLLMLAETYIQQGNAGAVPLDLINQVRRRAKAAEYTSFGSNPMDILMRERQVELCGEQSRYFDLIRWGIAKQVINSERAAEPGDGTQPFQDKNIMFPIPDVEKNYNPNIAKDVKNDWN